MLYCLFITGNKFNAMVQRILFAEKVSNYPMDKKKRTKPQKQFCTFYYIGKNHAKVALNFGPVDKCQKTAETRSGPGRIGNMQIEKDGACHPFKV